MQAVRVVSRLICLLLVVVPFLAARVRAEHPSRACQGDCDFSGRVDVGELIRGVNIALGARPLADCVVFDADGNRRVTIDELVGAVDVALFGCPAEECHPGQCVQGEFCESPAGRCGAPGSCEPVPVACPLVVDPVCGCDGVTYGNDCERRAAAVGKAHDGACEARRECGGFLGLPCAEGEICELPAAMCGGADLTGVCEARPGPCPEVYFPVCGCDGVTYGNDCERKRVGVAKDYDGECRAACGSRGQPGCAEGQFCELIAGTCGMTDQGGTCLPVPQGCPRIFDPVCGCDRMTYSNDCVRQSAGVSKLHDGECR